MEIILGTVLSIIMTAVMVVVMFRPNRNTVRREQIQAEVRQAEWQADQLTRAALVQMLDEARRHRRE